MGKTLSGTYSNGYLLASATLNPVTNTGTILLGTSANAAALEGETIAAWSVVNQGTIDGSLGTGIDLLRGGDVINDSSGWIAGAYGVAIQGVPGTVANYGTIDASSAAGGVFLTRGGDVTNGAYGTILGGYGVKIQFGPGSVLNEGTIAANPTNAAISLLDGGSVTNAVGGTLSGKWGISLQGTSDSTAVNAGTITGGTQSGVFLTGGTVTNAAGAKIIGNWGVADLTGAATVINAGVIVGTGGDAVLLPASYANRVVAQPGAAFTGTVDGGNTIGATMVSTLELAAGGAPGTLAGIGGAVTNFAAIAFDPGATWDIFGVLSGFGGTVAGFAPGDTISLTDQVVTSGTYAAGELTLFNNGIMVGEIAITGSFAGRSVTVTPDNGITIACFAAGTRIATPHGEVAVEALVAGQPVVLANGGSAPVRWIGRRRVDCRRHPEPDKVWPVRIAAGAFGAGRPARDLLLSPDHAVYLDGEGAAPGVLIPIRCLLNGATITQEQPAEVTYFHVELPAHAVILANRLPCESYLDLGNRGAFENGGGALLLHPDFAARRWQRDACAELILGGPRLALARHRLLVEATRLGHVATDDPGVGLRIGRRGVRPHRAGIGWRFLVPAGTRSVALVSRICVHPDMFDGTRARRHGVAVAALLLDRRAIELSDDRLGAGWHAPAGGVRWTDGEARIMLGGAREILLVLAQAGPYWMEQRGRAARHVSETVSSLTDDKENTNDAAISGTGGAARRRRAGAGARAGDDFG